MRASVSAWPLLARANGTKNFSAAWAPTCPSRTASCTVAGRSRTSASRRETQLAERCSFATSWCWRSPNVSTHSRSNPPSSSADRLRFASRRCAYDSASASSITRTTASTVSPPSVSIAATRRYPSMRTNRSARATTSTACCSPSRLIAPTRRAWRPASCVRSPEYGRSSWWRSIVRFTPPPTAGAGPPGSRVAPTSEELSANAGVHPTLSALPRVARARRELSRVVPGQPSFPPALRVAPSRGRTPGSGRSARPRSAWPDRRAGPRGCGTPRLPRDAPHATDDTTVGSAPADTTPRHTRGAAARRAGLRRTAADRSGTAVVARPSRPPERESPDCRWRATTAGHFS